MKELYQESPQQILNQNERRFDKQVDAIIYHNTIKDIIPPPSDRGIGLLSVDVINGSLTVGLKYVEFKYRGNRNV